MELNKIIETLAHIATIFGAVGVYLLILNYRARQLENRFNYLSKLYGEYMKDESMLRIFNDIEWLEDGELLRKMRDENEYKFEMERFLAIFENYLHTRETQLKGNAKGFEIYDYMVKRISTKIDIINYFDTILNPVIRDIHPYPKLRQLITFEN
jgi:hypothetical protein